MKVLLQKRIIGATLLLLSCTHLVHGQEIRWSASASLDESPVSTIYLGIDGVVLASTRTSGYRSTDGGIVWMQSGPRFINDFAMDSSNVVWAAGVAGVHRTADKGQTWEEVWGPVPVSDCWPYQVMAELLRYTGVEVISGGMVLSMIYEHGAGGCKMDWALLYSYNNGVSWHRKSLSDARRARGLNVLNDTIYWHGDWGGIFRTKGPSDPFELLYSHSKTSITDMVITRDTTFFVGTGKELRGFRYGRGVFRSHTRGTEWQQVNTGLTDTTITALVAHTDGHLFAGTESGGVFRSINNGDSWEPVNMGLDDLEITALAISDDGILYAGTKNGKVYRTEGTVVSSEPGAELPSAYRLGRNYPNPFNPSTTIPFTLPEPAHVTLKVYDLLGKEMTTLVSRSLPAGEHTATFNAADVATGVYLYRLTAGGYMETRRMAVVR